MTPADKIQHALNLLNEARDEIAQIGVGGLADLQVAIDGLTEFPENIWISEWKRCPNCAYYVKTTDLEPYGDRKVQRVSPECTVPDALKCPAVNTCGFADPDRPETYVPKFLRRQTG